MHYILIWSMLKNIHLNVSAISDFNISLLLFTKASKGAKIRNRYNQEPHLTQDTNGKVTNSQLNTTHESQEDSPFTARYHKAHINRRSQRLKVKDKQNLGHSLLM